MQFFTVPVLALLTSVVLAMPAEPEARALEARADCSRIVSD